jgi:hypothetical protein
MIFRSVPARQAHGLAKGIIGALLLAVVANWSSAASAADTLPAPGWQFRLTPYAWLPSVSGDATVRGHKANVDISFWDIFDSGDSGASLEQLAALMGYVEARNGPWSIYGDGVWGNFDFSGGAKVQGNPLPGVKASASANGNLDYETTMLEGGVAYQIATPGPATAVDVIGGARYWNQQVDLSLAANASVDVKRFGFERSGSRAVARSGTIEWVDPFVGLRVRHELSPGKELTFLGDVGGFGAGSDFTWQLFGGYSFDFTVLHTKLYGMAGYRALAVDYSQDGPQQNNINLIIHGPVVGLSFRW